MNKQQAYNAFWRQFGVFAFEENSVPDDDAIQDLIDSGVAPAKYPYITYQVMTGDLDSVLTPSASIWDRSNSYEKADLLSNQIAETIARMTPIKVTEGRMFITAGSPFSQHMEDSDAAIKRNVLTLNVEFLASY
jgi:hypothetical protein